MEGGKSGGIGSGRSKGTALSRVSKVREVDRQVRSHQPLFFVYSRSGVQFGGNYNIFPRSFPLILEGDDPRVTDSPLNIVRRPQGPLMLRKARCHREKKHHLIVKALLKVSREDTQYQIRDINLLFLLLLFVFTFSHAYREITVSLTVMNSTGVDRIILQYKEISESE